jgi:hypothetical protein
MPVRALMFIVPTLLLVGCSSTNVSNREPLADYVGRTVMLKRPMALIKEGRGIWAWSHLPRLRKSPYVMLDIDASKKAYLHLYPTDTNFIVLPVGHAVTIGTIRDEIAGIDPVHTTVYGRIILPGTDTPGRFAFGWGDTVRLYPAPWEPDNIPNRPYRIGWKPIPLYEPELRGVAEANIPRWGSKVGRN